MRADISFEPSNEAKPLESLESMRMTEVVLTSSGRSGSDGKVFVEVIRIRQNRATSEFAPPWWTWPNPGVRN